MMHDARAAVAELSRTSGFSLEDIEDAARSLRLAGARSYAKQLERIFDFPTPATSARQIQDALERLLRQVGAYGSDGNDIQEYVRESKSFRLDNYRARRASESATAMHFRREARPMLERRVQTDPLRHQRQRAWRRCSRRDQSDIRTEAR